MAILACWDSSVCLSDGVGTRLTMSAEVNAINAIGPHPWKVSFSYGRALQAAALKSWAGQEETVEAAQRAYYHRAKMNSAAATGMYAPAMEEEAVPV